MVQWCRAAASLAVALLAAGEVGAYPDATLPFDTHACHSLLTFVRGAVRMEPKADVIRPAAELLSGLSLHTRDRAQALLDAVAEHKAIIRTAVGRQAVFDELHRWDDWIMLEHDRLSENVSNPFRRLPSSMPRSIMADLAAGDDVDLRVYFQVGIPIRSFAIDELEGTQHEVLFLLSSKPALRLVVVARHID